MIVMWYLFMEIFKSTLLLSTLQAMLTQYELQNKLFINVLRQCPSTRSKCQTIPFILHSPIFILEIKITLQFYLKIS